MTDIFEEVEERLREDKLQTFWRRYGAWVIGAGVGVVALAGGVQVWNAWTENEQRSAGERFAAIQQKADDDPAASAAALTDFMKGAPGGYKALAEMERAAALQAQGDLAGALATFDNAAKLADQPVVRESAQLRAAYIAAETENFAAIEARLKPIVDARGPFSYLARELLGVEAYEAGQTERARQEFSYLEAALEAPSGVRTRAQSFLALLGPPPAAAAPASAPAPAAQSGEKK